MSITALDWRERASCRDADPELFYPIGDDWSVPVNVKRAERAKAVCAGCPVRDTCLEYAVVTADVFAVLGGTTPDERAPARREHRKAARTA